MSILAEQQLKRSLTAQEILQEATLGTLVAHTLEAVLDRVFRSIPDQKQVWLVVAFLLLATRPLSTKEFATVMFLGSVLDDGESVSPPWDLFERLERQRAAWFSGITVNKHSGIHLAHPLLEDVLRNPEKPGSPRYYWHEIVDTAHHDIAHICLSYLARNKKEEQQDLFSEEPFAVDSDLGFVSYAAKFWPYHLSLAQSTATEEAIKSLLQEIAGIDLERWSRTVWLLSNPFSRSRTPWNSPIPALISLGHPSILQPRSTFDIALGVEEAARAGDADLVNALLGMKAGQNQQSTLVEAVRAATSSGNESLSLKLLDLWDNLLFRAARFRLARLARKLLKLGIPVDPEIPYSDDGIATPLCVATVAGDTSTVEVLLEYGANVEFRPHLGRTPLSLAAAQGNADIIECLIRQGRADTEPVDDDCQKQNSCFIASEWGNPPAVKNFIELGVDPNKLDHAGVSPIIQAASFGHWRTVQALLDHGVANYKVPILIEDRIALAKLLLEQHNADINATNKSGRIVLMRAYTNILSKLAEFLLGYDPDVNLADKVGCAALHEATRTGNLPLVKLLLSKGADANAQNSEGNLPLHMCGFSLPLTRLLAENTEDIDHPNAQGVNQLSTISKL
ncbi:ankyrin repeat-containing domain protein [Xylaria venustula]|nr:ankyrin repeat-containing domain protein [Xylaria venustula]